MAINEVRFNKCEAHIYKIKWDDVFVSYKTTIARYDRKAEVLYLYPLNVGHSSTTSKQVTQWLRQRIGWDFDSNARKMFENWAKNGIVKYGEIFEWGTGKVCLDYECGIGKKDCWLNDAVAFGCDIL